MFWTPDEPDLSGTEVKYPYALSGEWGNSQLNIPLTPTGDGSIAGDKRGK